MSQQQPQLPAERMRPEYVDAIVDSDLQDDTLPEAILDLLNKDFPLSNIRSGDREYFRILADNIKMYTKELYAPEESRMTGTVGQALLEDPSSRIKSLSRQERVRIETVLMDHFARSSRGVRGWQQDKLSETINTSRVEDNREKDSEGTIFGGLFQ
jgi:hypothetical protein